MTDGFGVYLLKNWDLKKTKSKKEVALHVLYLVSHPDTELKEDQEKDG
jgi:hypothetical protein